MNTSKDFKGTQRAFKGCIVVYQDNIYNKDDKELQITHNDFNATIAYNGVKFILCYDDGMVVDSVAILNFKEGMQILKELIK